ncbi:helix-turn-helix domain-containing protein [Aquitalea denitrificans]|uniref:helix-turn-helix domain-containing protein n=1 Tax=Aquitalea denitrificans TaxID=519081 RepID=UPI0013576ED3|nr:helix-turn-helix transcriptional regulator [Aquitalea denitrificans]
MEPEVAFGRALRKLRKNREMSQEVLAFEAGVERNYVSLLELGRNSASVNVIFKLAKALEIRPSQLIEAAEQEMASQPGSLENGQSV